jgi:hypothetical protein
MFIVSALKGNEGNSDYVQPRHGRKMVQAGSPDLAQIGKELK